MTERTGTRAERKTNHGRKATWEQNLSYVYFERVYVRTNVNEGEREHLKNICFLRSNYCKLLHVCLGILDESIESWFTKGFYSCTTHGLLTFRVLLFYTESYLQLVFNVFSPLIIIIKIAGFVLFVRDYLAASGQYHLKVYFEFYTVCTKQVDVYAQYSFRVSTQCLVWTYLAFDVQACELSPKRISKAGKEKGTHIHTFCETNCL